MLAAPVPQGRAPGRERPASMAVQPCMCKHRHFLRKSCSCCSAPLAHRVHALVSLVARSSSTTPSLFSHPLTEVCLLAQFTDEHGEVRCWRPALAAQRFSNYCHLPAVD